MTIEELINKLQKLQEKNPGIKVVVSGFDEDGYEDVGTIEPVRIKRRLSWSSVTSHCGNYIDSMEATRCETGPEEKAVHINF